MSKNILAIFNERTATFNMCGSDIHSLITTPKTKKKKKVTLTTNAKVNMMRDH